MKQTNKKQTNKQTNKPKINQQRGNETNWLLMDEQAS